MTYTITLPRAVIQDTVDTIERYQVKRQDFDRFVEVLPSLRAALAQQAEQVQNSQAFETWAVKILGDNQRWRETGNYELAWQAWMAVSQKETK